MNKEIEMSRNKKGGECARTDSHTSDGRVARTRALLQQAHLSLILEMGYERVTVRDICAKANVGRSTFYAHFRGKDDLKRSGLERLRQELINHQRHSLASSACSSHPSLAFTLPMLQHAQRSRDLYRALAGGRGGVVSLRAIRKILADLAREEIHGREIAAEPDAREITVEFVVGAFLAIMTWWLDGGAQLPPERVDALFRGMVFDGLPTSKALE